VGPGPPAAPQQTVQAIRGNDAIAEEPCHVKPDFASFYPLTVGNSWHYSHVIRIYEGEGDPIVFRSTVDRDLIGTEILSDRQYVVEEERTVDEDRPDDPFLNWTRYRQDRAGLYYADICGCTPPDLEGDDGASPEIASLSERFGRQASKDPLRPGVSAQSSAAFAQAWARHAALLDRVRRALAIAPQAIDGMRRPGGPGEDEIQLLKYPLRPGSSWVLRPEFGLTWTVEQLVLLRLPAGRFPAYRIRIDFEGLGPTDRLHIWYGHAGRLAHRVRATTTVTDENGNPIGEFATDEIEKLESLAIARR
jgi:hypothetical protein